MKNIHVLPTDKPSRLRYNLSNVLVLTKESYRDYGKQVNQNIYITNSEEIKEGGYVYHKILKSVFKIDLKEVTQEYVDEKTNIYKIILTTDQDLIKDGVQAIDDEFLQWFVKNPTCEEIEVIPYLKDIINPLTNEKFPVVQHRHFDETKMIYKYHYELIIPKKEPKKVLTEEDIFNQKDIDAVTDYINKEQQKQHLIDMMESDEELGMYEEPKQETLEEAVKNYCIKKYSVWVSNSDKSDDFINGAKWQQERIYNEKKLYSEIEWLIISWNNDGTKTAGHLTRQIIEQLKKK